MEDPHTQPEPLAADAWERGPVGRLAIWADAALPAPTMLRTLAEEYGGRAAPALLKMADRVEAGEDLSQAFRGTEKLFPSRLRRQFAIAAAGDNLRTVLPALAAQRESTLRLTRQTLAILAYPIVVLIAVMAIAVLFSLFLIPQFSEIYNDFALELPTVTEVVLSSSNLIPFLAGLLVAAALATGLLLTFPPTARWLHWLATAPPIFGRVWVCHGHYSLSQLMASFTAAGMPVGDALRASAAGLSDRNLARAAQRAAERCESGQSLAGSLAASRHFERPLTALVDWGESHSSLPSAFTEASQIYRQQANHLLLLLSRVVPPLLLVFVILFVFVAVMALFLPLVSLIQALS